MIHLMRKEMDTDESALYEPDMVKSATPDQAKPQRSGEDEGRPGQGRKKRRPGVINLSGNGGYKHVIPVEPDDEQSDEGD